jgi:hypothetical protein
MGTLLGYLPDIFAHVRERAQAQYVSANFAPTSEGQVSVWNLQPVPHEIPLVSKPLAAA